MDISKDTQLQVLHEHYHDSCEHMRESVRLRDRLFLFVLLVIGLHFLQITNRADTSDVLISLLKEHAGFQIKANIEVLTAILWILLLSLVVRYFQQNVSVNRQYDYLHDVEVQFETLLGHPLISREGKSYLSKYPVFSKWMHFLYTWAFPILLLMTVTYKIGMDWPGCDQISGAYAFSVISYLLVVISTILYLLFLHWKNVKKFFS